MSAGEIVDDVAIVAGIATVALVQKPAANESSATATTTLIVLIIAASPIQI
jgi:hypothetical protein